MLLWALIRIQGSESCYLGNSVCCFETHTECSIGNGIIHVPTLQYL